MPPRVQVSVQPASNRRTIQTPLIEFRLEGTKLDLVDGINGNQRKVGDRSGWVTEYCVVLQKSPHKAKGVWKHHRILGDDSQPQAEPVECKGVVAVNRDWNPAVFSVLKAASLKRFLGSVWIDHGVCSGN